MFTFHILQTNFNECKVNCRGKRMNAVKQSSVWFILGFVRACDTLYYPTHGKIIHLDNQVLLVNVILL